MTATRTPVLGAPLARLEAREKVTGAAEYAYEHRPEQIAYAWIVGAEVARGRVRAVDRSAALAAPGVLAVLAHDDAPRLEEANDPELAVLQSPDVA
jgi:xanthine dehydrogenase YagR molybdenum-binding subunit